MWLAQKNDELKEVQPIKNANAVIQQEVQTVRKKLAKMKKMEDAIRKQEKVIAELEKALEQSGHYRNNNKLLEYIMIVSYK